MTDIGTCFLGTSSLTFPMLGYAVNLYSGWQFGMWLAASVSDMCFSFCLELVPVIFITILTPYTLTTPLACGTPC